MAKQLIDPTKTTILFITLATTGSCDFSSIEPEARDYLVEKGLCLDGQPTDKLRDLARKIFSDLMGAVSVEVALS